MIEIYTDGGCIGNPGRGGWAYTLTRSGERKEENGADPDTTNNRMELTAVIRALSYVESSYPDDDVVLHTDSQYVKNGITTWIKTWKQNGWKTATKSTVKNRDLWERLDALAVGLRVDWKWVKGHDGNFENERCDTLVHEAIRLQTTQ